MGGVRGNGGKGNLRGNIRGNLRGNLKGKNNIKGLPCTHSPIPSPSTPSSSTPSPSPKSPSPSTPIGEATIIFPATNFAHQPSKPPYNLQQWVNLVNQQFTSTLISLRGADPIPLSDLLSFNWSFYPYRINKLTEETVYLKSVILILTNSSPYHIVLNANISLLQFFGKSIGAMPMAPTTPCNNDMFPNNNLFYVQTMYVNYATENPDVQIATCGCNDPGYLIIRPNCQFYGLYDGFENDNLMNFSVRGDSTEKWIYHNLDTEDSHPFHFHLTSGFVAPKEQTNSELIVNDRSSFFPHTYALDVQGIPSQQMLSWYLRFVTYTSEDTALYKQKPLLNYLGFMYHCHYMVHHDMNMMGQYFVYCKRGDYF